MLHPPSQCQANLQVQVYLYQIIIGLLGDPHPETGKQKPQFGKRRPVGRAATV